MKILVIILACISICSVHAQYMPPGGIYPDAVFDERIRTARIFKEGWETSYPVSKIDDKTPVVLTFDDISQNARSYSYTIIHCDADWQQSRLSTDEYMYGFATNRISRFDFSFNTHTRYVHYRIDIPNNDVQLKVSGNYAIVVFEDGNESRPVMSRRFVVTESLVAVSAWAGMARQTARQNEWQQVEFVARTGNYRIENAFNDLSVTVVQNGQWNTARTGIKPLFIRQNEVDYRFIDQTLHFQAGNEYRPLDIRSTRFSVTSMASVEFERQRWHFFPFADNIRATGRYSFVEDLNGKYVVHAENVNRPESESDYVYVHFKLQAPQPFANGQVYVVGYFCNYAHTEENRMIYNEENRRYEATIMLKQGFYNYRYEFVSSREPNPNYVEGNFSATENDYIIFIYHRGRSARFDRLIEVVTVNTLLGN